MAKTIQLGLTAVLAAGLLAGCASPAPRNRKVYDRYAELVAQRSRASDFNADASAQAVVTVPAAPKPVAKPAAPAARTPARTVQAENPALPKPLPAAQRSDAAKPAPVKVMAPPPALSAEKPAAVSSPAPADSAPAPAAPVAAAPVAAPAMPAPVPPSAGPSAPAGGQAPDSEPPSSPDGVAYVLKPGDVVQIYLRGIPTAEMIEGTVDENGMVSLPFINEVLASGQTASELARSIRNVYLERGIYQNISVNVVVPARYYFIQGEIRAPGRFQLVTAMRVSQAIAGAGGYSEFASGQVLVKRGGKIVKTIRNARRLERTPEDDILLEPDDIIEVKRSLW